MEALGLLLLRLLGLAPTRAGLLASVRVVRLVHRKSLLGGRFRGQTFAVGRRPPLPLIYPLLGRCARVVCAQRHKMQISCKLPVLSNFGDFVGALETRCPLMRGWVPRLITAKKTKITCHIFPRGISRKLVTA